VPLVSVDVRDAEGSVEVLGAAVLGCAVLGCAVLGWAALGCVPGCGVPPGDVEDGAPVLGAVPPPGAV
jgi:hypothetical protein